MNILLDLLPESVIVDDQEYPVLTNFRDWILFDLLIKSDKLKEEEKPSQMLAWYAGEPPPHERAIPPLLVFYSCGKEPESEKPEERVLKSSPIVMDFDADAGRILSAFRETYSINLLDVEYMHWWEFKALLDGVGKDTELMRVIGYRAADTSGLSKQQKAFYAKMKKLYAIGKQSKNRSSLTQRNEAMKQYINRRIKQAE